MVKIYLYLSFQLRKKLISMFKIDIETSFVTSYHYGRRFAIHGRNIHLPASQKRKLTWFVYLCHDTVCQLLYVGSTGCPKKNDPVAFLLISPLKLHLFGFSWRVLKSAGSQDSKTVPENLN